MRALGGIGVLIAMVACAAFLAHGNATPVSVDLLITTIEGRPLWQVLLGALALGTLLAGLACAWPILRLRVDLRRRERRITYLEQEIHGLRTLPIEPQPEPANPASREG